MKLSDFALHLLEMFFYIQLTFKNALKRTRDLSKLLEVKNLLPSSSIEDTQHKCNNCIPSFKGCRSQLQMAALNTTKLCKDENILL